MRVTIIDNEYTCGNGFEADKLYTVDEIRQCTSEFCDDAGICNQVYYIVGKSSICTPDCCIIEED